MTKILITGASGFIGGFFVEQALMENLDVYAGIRKTSSKNYLTDQRIKFLELNFSDKPSLISQLQDLKNKGIYFDYIIHNAGLTKTYKKKEYYRVNCQNTKNFIESLIETQLVPKKFLFMSSLAAFGAGNPDTLEPIKLTDTPNPNTLYGKSKLEAEKFILSLPGFTYLIFRPTGVYGPREKDYYVSFKTINQGIESYIGYKQQYLTFIYVKDLVRLAFIALKSEIIRKAYFIADGDVYTTNEFNEISKRILNKKTIKIRIPAFIVRGIAFSLENILSLFKQCPTLNSDKVKLLESVNWKCDITDLIKDFNFEPEYKLEKGIQETIQWYKNEKWL